jgi:proteasome accessory factor B
MLERLTNLVALLLETRRPLTLDEISHALAGQYPELAETRRRAFERDKAVLRDEGVPIDQVVLGGDQAGATGYWIERSRFELPDLGLTDDESRALRVAVATVHLGVDWAVPAVHKLDRGEVGELGGDRTAAALPSLDALPSLFDANTARAAATFTYRERRRTIDPYGLLARQGRWYVVGRDHDAGALRTFRVDRIDGEVTLGERGSFEVPAGFDPVASFPSDPKLIGEGDVIDARVWISPARAAAVIAEVGEQSVVEQRDGGSIVVAVPFANRWAFRSWLLGLLDDAEVLSPPDMRAEVVEWLDTFISAGAAP